MTVLSKQRQTKPETASLNEKLEKKIVKARTQVV